MENYVTPYEPGEDEDDYRGAGAVDEFFDKADRMSGGGVVSKEDSERDYNERMVEKVTPELLRYFSREDALDLVKYFSRTPSAETQSYPGVPYDLGKLSQEAKDYLVNEIRGKRVIELGDAGRRINEGLLLKLGATSVEYADSKYTADGLTHLMKQEDGSAVVCSFGLFDEGVLYMDGVSISEPLQKYVDKLCAEIHRVTPRGGITFHGLEYSDDLRKAGFENDSGSPRELNKQNSSDGGLKVLRK